MGSKQDTELGSILLELGFVHQEQIDEALELQKIRPKRLDELLIDLGYVDEDHLLDALSRQFDIPVERNVLTQVERGLTTKTPINFIREYRMAPFRQNGSAFYVAINDPMNMLPLDDLRLLLGGPVVPVLCRRSDIDSIMDSYFDQQSENAADMIGTISMTEDDDGTPYQNLDALESQRDLLDLAN